MFGFCFFKGPVPYSYEQQTKTFLKLQKDPNHVKPTKPTPGNLFSWLNLRNVVRFHLWTRKNPELAQELRFNDMESVRTSNFDPARLTKIVIHGYADGASEVQIGTWIVEMRDSYLQLADVNYIAVDYAVLASFFLYFTAVPEMVGERVAEMIMFLHDKHELDLDPLHIIGWSWGAQIAGLAGHRLGGKVGRITGIDPAGPTFKYVDDEFRLDKTDAKFVDIIHVNGGKLLLWGYYGLEDSIGHVDIFPNGGKKQIGCPVERTLIYETLWCSHGRGVRYYTESITSPVAFPACRCESFDKFVRGECLCDEKNIVYMGEHLSVSSPHGNFYLITKAKEPYGHGYAMNMSFVSDIKDSKNSSSLNPNLSATIRFNGTTERFLIQNTYNALVKYPNDDILNMSLALTRSQIDQLPNVEIKKTDEDESTLRNSTLVTDTKESIASSSVNVVIANKNSTVGSQFLANQTNTSPSPLESSTAKS
ncbi:unnamed protein product [Orchesella dallaii]|uniref:Lipase domain-containing protein n=1 Tax=Orchesella dallaii TaxID=48710 RepID=A0ABP1S567_9HEXA